MTGDQTSLPTWKINPHKPSVARVYDYILGGKDNFAVDREMGDKILQAAPDAYISAKLNKEFGRRTTKYAAAQGIRQFIDLGSGIPTTSPSTHDTARAVAMNTNVVYVDHDPIVVAHSQALRDTGPGLETILADLRDPDTVLDNPDLLRHIDFTKPVGLLILSVFQTVSPTADAHSIMRRFSRRMAPGSILALSHVSTRSAKSAIDHVHKSAQETGYPPVSVRSDEEILGFFEGFELVEPGLVDIKDWRPGDEEYGSLRLKLVGAVGRKTD